MAMFLSELKQLNKISEALRADLFNAAHLIQGGHHEPPKKQKATKVLLVLFITPINNHV